MCFVLIRATRQSHVSFHSSSRQKYRPRCPGIVQPHRLQPHRHETEPTKRVRVVNRLRYRLRCLTGDLYGVCLHHTDTLFSAARIFSHICAPCGKLARSLLSISNRTCTLWTSQDDHPCSLSLKVYIEGRSGLATLSGIHLSVLLSVHFKFRYCIV